MPILEIKAVTWAKDSHGLFDYESRNYSQKKFKVEHSSIVARNEKTNEISVSTLEEARLSSPLSEENQLLTIFNARKGCFGLDEPKFEINVADEPGELLGIPPPAEKNDVFLIVRSLKNSEGAQKGYALNVGDVIKLGRMEYTVLEMRNDKEMTTRGAESVESMLAKELNHVMHMERDVEGVCRICLTDDQSEDNFLVAPCLCKGSCEMTHLSCLKLWLETKIKKKSVSCATLLVFKGFECEICTHPLPKSVVRKGVSHDLFNLERPASNPYIIIQSHTGQKQKCIHILEATRELIKIGRGHNCEVRVSDISVSRMHAFIKYEEGSFLIIDNNSKFGTLIKAKHNLSAGWDKIAVQVGRTVITFVLKQRESTKEKSKTISNFSSLSNFKNYLK